MKASLLAFLVLLLLAPAAHSALLTVDGKLMPDVVCHFFDATMRRRKPVRMKRTTDAGRIRRNRLAECGKIAVQCTGDSQACVDYPFASTYDGGAGARAACVNITQAAALSEAIDAFYLARNVRDGDKFNVLLTKIPNRCWRNP